ncbi:MAG: 16S rRNA (adenine(1518)-N(6)/adenine(1519)-N(6))-dimethyltransferase RsmA [Geminicoccaceae bacterium]|nr:16S rRNA (adenine(1518)-N(6)/adenine(1519)-N(6))-dimethyltransferase RsmA [Geminicoccaceae bacterium]
MDLSRLPRLAEVVRAAGLAPDRRLGQHFLLDPAVLARVAASAGPIEGRPVVEVGPGPGGLTRALLERGAFVTAIEKDPRCVEALRPLVAAAEGRLRVIGGDALRLPLAEVADAPATVVANLPYNVGTALLVGWLHELDRVRAMHLMFQREVALRLGAAPGGADYGRLSVLAQLLCRVERRFDLPPGAFQPPPKVRSSVVSLWPLESRPEGTRLRALERVTAAAFGQRRKMLRSSLNGLGQAPEALAEAAGVSATARAETLAPAQFLKMAERLVGG